MPNNAIPNGPDGDPSDASQQEPGIPTAVLLFPFDTPPPDDWRSPWLRAGWSVSVCGSPEEMADALGQPATMALVVSPWPGIGDFSSADAVAGELQGVINALRRSDANASIGLSVGGEAIF